MNRIILEKDCVIVYRKDMENCIKISNKACKKNYKPLNIECQRVRKSCIWCPLCNVLTNYEITDEEINICLRKKKLEKLLS